MDRRHLILRIARTSPTRLKLQPRPCRTPLQDDPRAGPGFAAPAGAEFRPQAIARSSKVITPF
jgi:hypothetical protein